MQATDVETYIGQVWTSDVRPLVEESWRCYNAGAIRASIATTWAAVTTDIISKLVRLADDGDAEAARFAASITKAQAQGISPEGVRAMQKIEDTLLDQAATFELIDSIGIRELKRIREDRNLCVHPSLRTSSYVYEPRPEVARSHLAVALSTLLVHPPTQGRKALESFVQYISDPFFVDAAPHIQAAFFDRVRMATRRNMVSVAAKHALLELETPTVPLAPAELADRMGIALNAFATRDRELVRAAVADLRSRFEPIDGARQLRTLARLGDQDYFWDIVDDAMAARFSALLGTPLPLNQWDPLPAEIASPLALVRSDHARARLPILKDRFNEMHAPHRIAVAAIKPDPYFLPAVIDALRDAKSFRTGEQAGQLAVQHAAYLNVDTLKSVLVEWANNVECRQAVLMPELAITLFHTTAHLGIPRIPPFHEFLTQVRTMEEPGSYYSYPGLETALRSEGYL